jgi:hypothetical protein
MKLNRKKFTRGMFPVLLILFLHQAEAGYISGSPAENENLPVRGMSFLQDQQAGSDMEHITVFSRGEDGYHTYRIPSIIQGSDGTLVAIVEGRRDSSSDPGGGHIDLVYKLSHDGGRTWSQMHMFEKSQEGWGASNPTVVVNSSNNRILVLYNVWQPGRGQNQGNCRPG